MAEFMRLRERLEHEMEERFDSQDEIIDSLSQSIKTFQDTMKIVGETVCWKGLNSIYWYKFKPTNSFYIPLLTLLTFITH